MGRRLALGAVFGAVALLGLALLWPRAAAPAPLPAPLAGPAPAGRLAYAVAGNIWTWQGGAHQVTRRGHDGSPALAPDGSRLAYVRYDDSFSDIVVSPVSGGDPTFLTNNRPSAETGSPEYVQQAIWALQPAWNPDGDRLAYVSDRGTDAPVLWIMGAGGENPHSLETSPPNPPLEHPRWAPDGGAIVATSLGSGKDEIWSLGLDPGAWNEVAAPADGAYDPVWSPDGKWIAYAARAGRATDIWAAPPDRSSAPVQLTHLGRARAPVFSPDGGHLAFLAEADGAFQIYWLDLQTGAGSIKAGSPRQLTSGDSVDATSGLSWSK